MPNRFIKIGNKYYNINYIKNFDFEKIYCDKEYYFIDINEDRIQLKNEEEYRTLIDMFVEFIGEENIYE